MKTLTLVLLFVLLMACPVFAQDATSEPTADVTQAPISIVTAEAPNNTGDVNVTVNTPAAETPAPAENSVTSAIVLILGVLATMMIAVSLGLQVIGNRAKQISDNPIAVAALEQGYTNLPDLIKEATTPIRESLERSDEALKYVLELVKKLTDNIPESEKVSTVELPQTSTLTQQLPLDGPSD